MTARIWLNTLNNPSDHYPDWDPESFLEKIFKTMKHVVAVQGQMEKKACLHLQYKIWFSQAVRASHMKRFCKFSSLHQVKVDNCPKYTEKDDTRVEGPWTFGEIPLRMNNKEDRKVRDQRIYEQGVYKSFMNGDLPLVMVPQYQKAIGIIGTEAPDTKPKCEGTIPNTWDLDLPLLEGKQKHYWFWSTLPDRGKTEFQKALKRTFPCAEFNSKHEFQGNLKPGSQFLLIDEFTTAKIKAQDLNQMCDGTYQYQIKFQKSIMLEPIVICCGNKHPQEVYPECFPYIQARFNVFCVDKKEEEYIPMYQE